MTRQDTRNSRNTSLRIPHAIGSKIDHLFAIQNAGRSGYFRRTRTDAILTALDAGLNLLLDKHTKTNVKPATTRTPRKGKRPPK